MEEVVKVTIANNYKEAVRLLENKVCDIVLYKTGDTMSSALMRRSISPDVYLLLLSLPRNGALENLIHRGVDILLPTEMVCKRLQKEINIEIVQKEIE